MNENWTLKFNVNDDAYAGKQFFFKIILKEEGLDVLGNSYYCTILVDAIEGGGGSEGGSGGDSGSGTEGGSGTDTSTGDEAKTDDDTETDGSDGEGSGDPSTGGGSMFQPGRVRRGIVLTSDTYMQQRAKERTFIEVYTTDLLGQTRLKFTEPVNMTVVERDFGQLF